MADTHPLQFSEVPVPPPTSAGNNLATPSRRGHSHRRSFAVSGDFEFLKQCPPGSLPGPQGQQGPQGSLSVPPLPRCASPDPVATSAPRFSANEFEKPVPTEVSFLDAHTPRKISHGISSPSPRFFISEEPRFTSPVKGVPDAIINLDDALKTKPKSFKSHRRSESAPADLEIVMNFKNTRSIPDFRIDEEETNNNEEAEQEDDGGQTSMPFGLMSPLRPSSPAFKKNYQLNEQANSSSPTRLIFHQHHTTPTTAGSNSTVTSASDKYNSLKIKRQKQRYFHYTKQLPTNITVNTQQPQPQSLQEKKSTASLGSAMSKTPASFAPTPSNAANSPVTPLSNREFNPHSNNCNTNATNASGYSGTVYSSSSENTGGSASSTVMQMSNSGGEQRRARSPDFSMYQQMHQKYPMLNNHLANHAGSKFARRNSGPAVQSSFRFESKVYDMPLDKREVDQEYPERSVTPRFGDLSPAKDDTFNGLPTRDENNNMSSEESVTSPVEIDQSTGLILSQDILMGEPGDTVDLSNDNTNADVVAKLQSFSMNSSTVAVASIEQPVAQRNVPTTTLPPKTEAAVKTVQNETRSASDSIVEMNSSNSRRAGSSNEPFADPNTRTAGKKKRSKLSIFTNLFSR